MNLRTLLPLLCLLSAVVPAAAVPLTSGDLKIDLDGEGRILELASGGKPWPLVRDAPSGLLLRDVAAGGDFLPAGGSVSFINAGIRQAGTNAALKLDFLLTIRARAGALEFSGFVHDYSGQDRAITVRFAVPLDLTGGTWWQDLHRSQPVAGEVYANLHQVGVGATGSSSSYPWGAVSAGGRELCLGVPLDKFVVHRIAYDGPARCLCVDFDFGLSTQTHAFPSKAEFSGVLYPADARWGLRAATAGYYRLFPGAFTRRAKQEGLWMPFTDIAKLQDPEDFNFAFQEGAPNVPWDEAHGIYSFRYLSPHWAMLWMPDRQEKPTPEYVTQKLAEDLKSGDTAARWAAEVIVNCAARNAQGERHYSIGQAHWAPHKTGHLGWYAMFPANADPDLKPEGGGPTTGSETMAAVERALASYDKPGAFLDGFYFDGVDERPLDNYAGEQFATAAAPLTFATETKRPVLCGAFSSYKFLQRVAEKMHASRRMVIANGIPSQFPFSTCFLDAGGSEQEPSIEKAPVSQDYLSHARCLMYHKPLLLLYKPRLEERFDRDLTPYLVDYMHACLPYAAEPSLFMIFSNTDAAFYYNFWERPDWYNRYRSVFVNYLPLVKRLALAGWEPVTLARAQEPTITVERFGSGADLHLVAYNPAREGAARSFDLEVEEAACGKGRATCAVDLVDGTAVPVQVQRDGSLRLHLTLPPRRAAVLAFAPRSTALAALDLEEAARYAGIAGSRLQDKLHPAVTVDFESDPGGGGIPLGFSPYTEGNATFASDTATVHSAPRATRVRLGRPAGTADTPAGPSRTRAVQSVSFPVKPAQRLRFSVWGKTEFPTPGSLDFYVRWRDGAGKDLGAPISSPGLTATSDWKELSLETTAPEQAAAVMFALVAARTGEGAATAWFDDPAISVLKADGTVQKVLPVPPVAASPAAAKVAQALRQWPARLAALAAASVREAQPGADKRCSELLALSAELAGQAQAVRRTLPDCPGVAAALDVSAGRLQRAGGLLAGWRLALTGGGQTARGEAVPLQAHVTAGPVALRQVTLIAGTGSGDEGSARVPAPPPFSLAAGQSRDFSFAVTPREEDGGSVTLVARATVGGQVLELRREASYTVVSPGVTQLVDLGQDDGGAQRLLLVAGNARRTRPLSMRVRVTPGEGLTPSVGEQTLELKAQETVKLPLVLRPAAGLRPGWRETTVSVTWEGGEQLYRQPLLYLPPAANLLKNPGFEEGRDTAAGWSAYGKGGYAVDTSVPHGGGQAIRVSGPDAGAVQRVELNQQVARPLVLRGFSRHDQAAAPEQVLTIGQTEQVPAAGGSRSGNYALYLDLHYAGGGALYGQVAAFDRTAEGWQFAEKVINVARPVKDATLYLLHRGEPGTAWFDDLSLAETDPDLALLPGAKVSADSTYSGYGTAALTDGVTETAGVAWDKAAWACEETKGEHWVELTFPQEVTLRTVLVYWAVDLGTTWTSRDYVLEAFVEGAWRQVGSVTGQAPRDFSVHSLAPVRTTRLRLLQRAGGGPAARPNILWLREIAAL